MRGAGGQRRVPISFFSEYQISLPPIQLQEKYAEFVQQVDKLKLIVQNELAQALLLYDSLIQQYFD